MTRDEFRSNKGRCMALARLIAMPTFQNAVTAIFEGLDIDHAHILNNALDASERVEMRLIQQRKGHNDFILALKMLCEPLETAVDDPEPDYGAGEEAARQMSAGDPWTQEPVEL